MTLAQLRKQIGNQLGFGINWSGDATAYRNLSAANQIRFNEAVALYIKQNPAAFTPTQQKVASDRVATRDFGSPLLDTSLSASAGDFVDTFTQEIADQLGTAQKYVKIAFVILAVGAAVGIGYKIYKAKA